MARDTVVFISYARADEQYATELMARLSKEPDIAPWQDRISMRPGDFEGQIKEGIDAAQYFVLVMTPAALRSPWVEKEWRYARENGRCICPIKPTFDAPSTDAELDAVRETLPVWMQKIQTYDFEQYWKRFVAVLQSPCQATRAPFLAASLPSNFVQRAAEFGRVLDAVLDAGRKNPSGKTVALHGSGGFGKTTLALGVCHDADVFTACDGGILWVTLGEQPSVVPELEKIYAALTGERPGFKSQDDAMFEVGRKLDGKRCLIVIDDVWNLQDLKPFLHGGAQSSRLITTRRFTSVAVHAATDESCRINVGELTPDEAERILAAGLARSGADLVRFRSLADRLHRQPLLLHLANRALLEQIALGQSADAALDWALQKYVGLGAVAFDQEDAVGRDDAIAKTVEVSLGFLRADRARCLELGVFPEDAEVPFAVLGLLWNMKEPQVQDLVQRLHDLALVKLNLPGRSIALHDYVRKYFAVKLEQPAPVHGRLADAWKDPKRLPGGYALQQVAYHVTESMADPQQVIQRGGQFLDLLMDSRYGDYQRQHGDATALDRYITRAIARGAESIAPEAPALIASLGVLRKSYGTKARDATRIFEAAAEGRLSEAAELVTLFQADQHWDTLARLLIAWVAPPDKAAEARALADEAEKACDRPHLLSALAWVRVAPDGVPQGLPQISGGPDLRYVSAILQRAGGAETLEGLEPLDFEAMTSGTDAVGFIAERDGPDLVSFARLDPDANTQYLERYIEIHAANRYVHYRNRSLWVLLKPILQVPDAAWVRRIVQRIATAALTVASVDFEEFLPLAVQGLLAHGGDPAASALLDETRQRLLADAAAMQPSAGRTDSWSHYHRRASALAEVYAVALGRPGDAAPLLQLARDLPKGFAGFRAFSALTLAESTIVAARTDRAGVEAALTSALAASHRIQDHLFCLRATAMVNAMKSRWLDMSGMDLEATIERFLDNPLADEFCSVHHVLEDFEYRTREHEHQALPIPKTAQSASTLAQIAEAFDFRPDALVRVNGWIWAAPEVALKQVLKKDDEVCIPDPDFTPVLAARFVAEALASEKLSDERRSLLIQRLVRLALSNTTVLDTVLARLMLTTRARPAALPALLSSLPVPASAPTAGGSEAIVA